MAFIAGKVKESSDLTAWMEYDPIPGFRVEIRFTPNAQFFRMEDRSRKKTWDAKTHKPSEEIDRQKMAKELAHSAVCGWELTGEQLRQLLDLTAYPEGEIPFSEEDCAELLSNNLDVYLFVHSACREMAYFDAVRRAEAEKNSLPSPGERSTSALRAVVPSTAESA